MAHLELAPTHLRLHLTRGEKVGGLLRDQDVPLDAVDRVEVVADALGAAVGLRAPGLALPGLVKIGTWRSRRERRLVVARRGEPALRLSLSGQRYDELVVSVPDPVAVQARIVALRPELAPGAWREEHVRFHNGAQELAGTLTLPPGTGPFPAVLLVPGSGPVDRDSDHPRMRLGITRELAHALAASGIASLRYDKRGVGRSPGDWRAAGFTTDNADDAEAALRVLAGLAPVDPGRLVLLGHSEGALLATMLAARGAAVRGLVLLACSARRGEELLRWQARVIAPTLPAPARLLLRLLRVDLGARVRRNHKKVKATTGDVARVDGVRINARWTREFLAYDPASDLRAVRVPVLAVNGGADIQVPPEDAHAVAALVPGEAESHVVPDVSHVLRRIDGTPSLRAYRSEIRRPLDPRVVDLVVAAVTRCSKGLHGATSA